MTVWFLLAAVGLLIANGFFVAMEFALLTSRVTKLEPMAADGNRRAAIALGAMSDLQRQLGGAQLGITLASVALGLVGEPAVAHLIEPLIERIGDPPESLVHAISLVIALSIVVSLHMILGEMVPKNLAIAGPEPTLLWLAPIHRAFVTVFGPLIVALNVASNVIVRLLGHEPVDELATAHSASEFERIVDAGLREGTLEEFEHTLLSGALDFADRPAQSVIVSPADMVTVTRRMTLAEVEEVVVSSGHSRLPMIDANIDDVIGFVHAKDLLKLPPEAQNEPVPLESIRRLVVVRPDRTLEELMVAMKRRRSHMAILRTTGGRTAGLVTLEDVIEEIVGEIRDESDRAGAS